MKRWSAMLLVLVSCVSDSEVQCTLLGCQSSVPFALGQFAESTITPTATSQAIVDVCLNDVCGRVALDGLPEAIQVGGKGSTIGMTGPGFFVGLTRRSSDSIDVSVGFETTGVEELFHDGDRYHVTFTSSDGQILVDRSWAVDYKTTYPNGPDCGVCLSPTSATEL